MDWLKNATQSPRTTILGVLTFLSILVAQLILIYDSDPNTNFDLTIVVGALLTMLGLSQTRDANKRSEDHK